MGGVGGAGGGAGGRQGGAPVLHRLSDMLLACCHGGGSPLAGGYDGWGGEGVQNLEENKPISDTPQHTNHPKH